MEDYTMTKLLAIELDEAYEYDVTESEAQAELDSYVGLEITMKDVWEFYDEEDRGACIEQGIDIEDVFKAAICDWLTNKTGLLVADLEMA